MQVQEELCPFSSFAWVKSGSQEQNLFFLDCFCIMHLKTEGTPIINHTLLDNNNFIPEFNSLGDSVGEKRVYPTNHDKDLCWTLAPPINWNSSRYRSMCTTSFLVFLSTLILFFFGMHLIPSSCCSTHILYPTWSCYLRWFWNYNDVAVSGVCRCSRHLRHFNMSPIAVWHLRIFCQYRQIVSPTVFPITCQKIFDSK